MDRQTALKYFLSILFFIFLLGYFTGYGLYPVLN